MRGLTKNQVELLTLVRSGGPDGELDFDQLLALLSWKPSKESAQFTIRALVAKGLLQKLPELQFRRSRKRICYRLTPEGLHSLDPRKPLMPELPEVTGLKEEGLETETGIDSFETEESYVPGLVILEDG